jgi:hypothetical protein
MPPCILLVGLTPAVEPEFSFFESGVHAAAEFPQILPDLLFLARGIQSC